MWYDQTGLPWISPSPNIPTLKTSTVYPGQVFLEGTNISEGRGTTKPFEQFGTPWINGRELAQKLNTLALPGVKFREISFTPSFSKFTNKLCSGAQLHVQDRTLFQPFITTLHIIKTIRDMCPYQFQFHEKYFDKILGSTSIREAIEKGDPVAEIIREYTSQLDGFAKRRQKYLLY